LKYLTPCSQGCPVNTDIPGYIDAIIREDYLSAYRIIKNNNPFPSVCAWICPHPCEDRCRRTQVDEPVNIRALKRFAVELGRKREVQNKYSEGKTGNIPGGDVAIIGSGPSGLTAAHDLVRRGFSVTVFERHSKPGGHFAVSLPLFRLPRSVLFDDINEIQKSGVDMLCEVEIGKEVSIDELRARYKAVILAVGLQRSKMLPIPGGDHPAVLLALPFLQNANGGTPLATGRRVIVIGGGDVAMDVARTAIRQGAQEVKIVCLESLEEMPAHDWEVQEAREEGVAFHTGLGPLEVITRENGQIEGLKVQRVVRVFDEKGCFSPQFDARKTETLAADTIIISVGQAPLLDWARHRLELDGKGNLLVDRDTLSVGVDGFFACGEVAQGPGAAISAIQSGHRVADSVAAYLLKGKVFSQDEPVGLIGELDTGVVNKIIRNKRKELNRVDPADRIKNFATFEKGFCREEGLTEAGRCLRCGLGAQVDISRCIGCLTCQRVCPYGVPAVVSRARISADACQSCGICAAACPAGAITILGINDFQSRDNLLIRIYVCRKSVGRSIVPTEVANDPVFSNSLVNVLPCAGSLRKDVILADFEGGTQGVALIFCGDGCSALSTHSSAGGAEVKGAKGLISDIGLGAGRLEFIVADGKESLMASLTAFVKRVSAMGPLW
jgi:NADPH-dependent glutamate synthase beta subunit-like oxidoreductase/ferredoxin